MGYGDTGESEKGSEVQGHPQPHLPIQGQVTLCETLSLKMGVEQKRGRLCPMRHQVRGRAFSFDSRDCWIDKSSLGPRRLEELQGCCVWSPHAIAAASGECFFLKRRPEALPVCRTDFCAPQSELTSLRGSPLSICKHQSCPTFIFPNISREKKLPCVKRKNRQDLRVFPRGMCLVEAGQN